MEEWERCEPEATESRDADRFCGVQSDRGNSGELSRNVRGQSSALSALRGGPEGERDRERHRM